MYWRAALVVLLAGGAAVAVAFQMPLCPAATFFGIPCPGCGLTRATLALLAGDVPRALRLHPLVFLLAPLYFGLLGAAALSFVRGRSSMGGAAAVRPWFISRNANYAAWALLVLVIGVWIARFFGAFGGPAPVTALWNVR